jgi:hypothetical protein
MVSNLLLSKFLCADEVALSYLVGILRNTPRSGNLAATDPSALMYCFAKIHHAKGRLTFQALLPFTPINVAVPAQKGALFSIIFRSMCQ